MKKFISLLLVACLAVVSFGQNKLLSSGPMLGYLTMHELMIWVQTTKPAKVQIAYYPTDNPKDIHWTNMVQTQKSDAFTAHLLVDQIQPGKIYHYNLYINDKKIKLPFPTQFKTKIIWHKTDNPPTYSFAASSGSYINDPKWDRPGKPYGGGYQIYRTVYKVHPDFVIWLGDNVYLRQNEWNSWTGIVYRYTHDRRLPQLQPLLANVYNYAIWDDHDFGPNDSDGSFPFKGLTLKAFKDFWANPSYGLPNVPGAFTYFNWYDADFFLLDDRYYRDPDHMITNGYKTELGKAQLDWLKKALVFSKATFKFIAIGGQFLNTAARFETYSNYGFDKERQNLIDWIHQQKIYNVIFLTGDRHFTVLSKLSQPGEPTIWDVTLSPFNSHPATGFYAHDDNKLEVPGTLVTVRNFGLLTVSGPQGQRKLTITVYDVKGNVLWTKTIPAEYKNSQTKKQ